jgi:hypothetical protein
MYKCPHCFQQFKKREAPFRCGSITQICSHTEDVRYNQFHDVPVQTQGRVLQSQASRWFWNKKESCACDVCATITHQRICPQCHHNLPAVFFASEFVALGFICQRRQELETYMIYLKKILEKVVADDLNLILRPELSATPFDLYLERNGSKKPFTILHIRFYPLESHSMPHDLGVFNGIFLFCDKENAVEGRAYVPESIQDLILSMQRKKVRNQKISVPLAVVYSCFESLSMVLPSTHPLFRQRVHGAGYDREDGQRISSEMLGYTGYWFGANLLQLLKRYFSSYRLFCQSFSYPEGQPFLANSGWRIEDPLLWILASLGKIKTLSKKSDARS